MAKFSITDQSTAGFGWRMTGLTYAWGSGFYWLATLARNQFISGTTGSVGTVYAYEVLDGWGLPFGAPYEEGSMVVSSEPYSWVPSRLYDGPITFYPFIHQNSTNQKWSIGLNGTIPNGQPAEGITFYPASSRPPYFYWSNYGTGYAPQSRTHVNGVLSIYRPYAIAFNALRQNIIDLLVYRGVIASASAFNTYIHYFPQVSSGSYIYAEHYNKAASCVNAMGGSVNSVFQNTTLYELYFYRLEYGINSV